jgi:GTP-binding protein EngB required for normal cell division
LNSSNDAKNLSEEQSETIDTSAAEINLDSDTNLINSSKNDKKGYEENAAAQIQRKTMDVRATLIKDYYLPEVDHATGKLLFNILIIGSPRVGKSQLINALCNENLAKTSASLNSCTAKVECYILEDNQERTPGIQPFRIYFYDTPGIESWTNENGQGTMLKFIEEKNPVCLLYCASPGSFADLKQLHPVLKFCQTKQIFCALVCTNMWSNANRNIVLQEFEKELVFFGDRAEKLFDQGYNRPPHKVILFGNGALCTMVNSTEYYDPEISPERKPIQGIDELIHCIMEELDHDKLLGWCNAVLCHRTYWEKVTQRVQGFWSTHLSNLSQIPADQIAKDFAFRLFNRFQNQKKK